MKNLIVGTVICVTSLAANRAQAQNIFADLFRESVDEVRLQQDYRALQRDAANGNMVGAQYDLMRIQQDRSNLAQDQMQLNYDLGGGMYYPYPNYSSYYSPLNTGQMYYSPNQQPIPGVISPPGATLPASGYVPANPLPVSSVQAIPQTVRISNPASTGVTLSFIFGGTTYSIDSGRIEEFTVTAPTLITFSRGGQAGVARYNLTGGNTFEFRYDNTGWMMVQKRVDTAANSLSTVPTNPLPANPVPKTTLPAPGPSPTPSPTQP